MTAKDLPPAFRRIEEGAVLPEALRAAFPISEGWLSAVGTLEDVELKLAGPAADVRRSFPGRWSLIELAGPLSGPLAVTLSRFDGERVEVVAGMLEAARSGGVTAVCVSSFASGAPKQVTAKDPGAAATRTPESPAAAAPAKPLSSFAARVGKMAPEEEEDGEEQLEPERGDMVQHFAFGLCEVLSVSGDRIVLRDLSGPGRIREISLEVLSVTGPTERDGRRLFRLDRR